MDVVEGISASAISYTLKGEGRSFTSVCRWSNDLGYQEKEYTSNKSLPDRASIFLLLEATYNSCKHL